MRRRVYIETSVVSYLVARPSRNILAAAWQQVAQEWWDKQRARFELFTWNCRHLDNAERKLASGACVLLPDIAVRRSAPRYRLWGNRRTTDEIIREVWRAKDRLAKEFDYDLDALAADLQKRQKQTGRRVVNLAKDRVRQTAESPQ